MTGTYKEEIGSVCMDDASKLNTGLTDAISFLPDDVLSKILSLIPTKVSVSTSVLSKRWRNVFALVHNLDFDDSILLQPEKGTLKRDVLRQRFKSFVDRILAVKCGSPIKKFSLNFHILKHNDIADVSRWICDVLERGVLELDLKLKTCYEPFMCSEIFKSKALVKLSLGTKISLEKLPSDVCLPALKSLFLDSVDFEYEDLCYVLLPGCPVLEELIVLHEDYEQPYFISSQTIKKLLVHNDCEFGTDLFSGMGFNAPSLVSLDYSDYALSEYKPVNLESLVEARLDLHYIEKIERPDLSGLIKGISNVKTLHLSPDSVDVISRCVKQGLVLPVFNNLVSLSFGSKNKQSWRVLPYLLEQSPNLETLIIQSLDGFTDDITIQNNFKVKVLRVVGYRGTVKDLEHLKSFVGGTENLELVVMSDDGIILQTCRDLAVASKCEIKVLHFT